MANGVGPAIPPSENLLVDPGGNAVPPLLEEASSSVPTHSFARWKQRPDGERGRAVFILNFLFSGLASDCLDSLIPARR